MKLKKTILAAILLAAVSAAALTMSACGGGDTQPEDTTPVVSAAEKEESETESQEETEEPETSSEETDDADVDIDATLEDYIASDAVQNAVHEANQNDTNFYTELTAEGHTITKSMHLLEERTEDELVDMGDRFYVEKNHFPLQELVFGSVDVFGGLSGVDEFADGIDVTFVIEVYDVEGNLLENLCSTSHYEGK